MSDSRKLCITLPDKLYNEVERYRKSVKARSRSAAVAELLKYAINLPPYFKDFDWEKAEREADIAIKKGDVKTFDSVGKLMKHLDSL